MTEGVVARNLIAGRARPRAAARQGVRIGIAAILKHVATRGIGDDDDRPLGNTAGSGQVDGIGSGRGVAASRHPRKTGRILDVNHVASGTIGDP
ncbi:hypothetical protein D3C84_711570 [compost metagenome]